MATISHLTRLAPLTGTIAYKHIIPTPPTTNPGILLINGFYSSFSASLKHTHLETHCHTRTLPYLTYDHYAHGLSSGKMEDFSISRAADDLFHILDSVALSDRPYIFVGSSMGLWLSLIAAKERPHRVAGIVGLGGAINFTEKFENEIPAAEMDRMRAESDEGLFSFWRRPSSYNPDGYIIGWKLLQDGKKCKIGTNFPVTCPIELIHGLNDADVPYEEAVNISHLVKSPNVTITLVKGGNHRLSTEQDLSLLSTILDRLTKSIYPSLQNSQ
ncbi:hypothetical protein HK097_000484 [Rhizophlyctis rosea]|uniref:Palmitoyl-protein thioesterase ABHD10, mitochondrial n=1 Tax=Rhizophlyctis rosea TaxID=64517 RepID=A0AAD5SDK6_9FUNG|nr:hypothetical protein HK097_000484 [Rhizophlyctis rosea]